MAVGSPAPPDHWPLHAAQWSLIGPPLRPSPADIDRLERAVTDWQQTRNAPPRVLLLGVTPEIATMAWPSGTDLTAVDRCRHMIAGVFPRTGLPAAARAVQADWCAMPFPDATFDLVIGDGCFSTLPFPDGYRTLAAECRRLLSPGGGLIMRFFAALDAPEDLSALPHDLANGRIGNFHVLKWRLAMALQSSPEAGVRLADIWTTWRALFPDPAAVASALACEPAVVATIDAYRDSDVRYTFAPLAALHPVLGERFEATDEWSADYQLGDRCPTVFFR